MLGEGLLEQVGDKAMMSAAAVIGREADIDSEALEIFEPCEVFGRASAIAVGDVQRPRRLAWRVAIRFLVQCFPGQRQKRRKPNAAGDHDEVLGGNRRRLR
jgi:hypothetical protein